MNKLDYNHLTTGALTVDASHLIGVVNNLIDLVNSQQEAIEKLEKKVHGWRPLYIDMKGYEPADDKPFDRVEYEKAKFVRDREKKMFPGLDTHRTVTLRIPKGMTIGRTILEAMGSSQSSVLSKSDTDLQKALDEVQPNE